jgi:hypothetical protein
LEAARQIHQILAGVGQTKSEGHKHTHQASLHQQRNPKDREHSKRN